MKSTRRSWLLPFALGERHIGKLPQAQGLKPLVRRQLLHAWQLGLTHPRTGARLTWEAPLPEDFQAALNHLEERSNYFQQTIFIWSNK